MKEASVECAFGNATPLPESVRTKMLENLHELVSTLAKSAPSAGTPSVGEVEDLIRARTRRLKHFNARLFADPAWDMLLELYATELGQRRISVSSLCIASGSPGTTALRWITVLQKEGLVEKESDPLDGRRYFVKLTSEGSSAMANYFKSLPSGLRAI